MPHMQRNNIGFHLGTVTYKRACAGGLLSLCFRREEPVQFLLDVSVQRVEGELEGDSCLS